MNARERARGLLVFITVTAAVFFPQPADTAEDCTLARKYYKQGTALLNPAERREAFQKAVELCPSFAEARVNLADSLENLANTGKIFSQENLVANNQLLDKARTEYSEALKYNDRLFPAYLGLAENYFRVGLYEKARESYKKALDLAPPNRLRQRTIEGLKAVEGLLTQEKDQFTSAEEIVSRYKKSSSKTSVNIMGFEEFTVVRDRQRFVSIVFDEWSSKLNRKETIAQLEEIGKAVTSQNLTGCRFIVEGHTDNRGGYERNQTLSGQRAESVKGYLVNRFGVAPSRIKTQGFGYNRPRFSNDTPENRLKNRRVELLIIEQNADKK